MRRKLNGEDRVMLYAAALGTGFRASELASLTPAASDLSTLPATVTIAAADEKRRRGAVQRLPVDLIAMQRPRLAGRPSDAPLWPGKWAKGKQAGQMLKADLMAARDVWIDEAVDAPERDERARSDFLTWQGSEGQFVDFHALRHTDLSRLGRSGASPRAMQTLARHSTVELTIDRYCHAGLFDLSAAVDRLPRLPIARITIPSGRHCGQPGPTTWSRFSSLVTPQKWLPEWLPVRLLKHAVR